MISPETIFEVSKMATSSMSKARRKKTAFVG